MVDESKAVTRKPRADAERNRQQLLETAKAIFEAKGSAASLEEIAREAGLGIGTLYRHFPTRDELVEAVYRNETEQLAGAARRFAETMPPVDALRAWMRLFVEHLATKQDMSEALNSLVGGTSALYAASADLVMGAMKLLVERALANGEIRLNIDPLDLLRALAGVMTVGAGQGAKANAKRLVDVLIAGVRTGDGEASRPRLRAKAPTTKRKGHLSTPKSRPVGPRTPSK
jgi:AcrR family transcriptional regulator